MSRADFGFVERGRAAAAAVGGALAAGGAIGKGSKSVKQKRDEEEEAVAAIQPMRSDKDARNLV
eukprot:scaffold164324_cov27-Tisochrysis_lutea.AAC.1